MTEERIAALDKIGMIWNVPDYIWEENYAAAVRYHWEHGDLNVPAKYVDAEGIKLGQWIQGLRSNRNGTAKTVKPLTDEQIARLDAIGMIWGSKYDKQWDDAFRVLCNYQCKNGTLDIPSAYVTDSGIRLGAWVRRQRDFFEQGKLSDERIEKLRSIGFVLEKADPWEEKYQLAKAYYDEHGNLRMPGDTVINGVWLWKWLNEQKNIGLGKRRNKHLSNIQIEKLSAIGMIFEI